MYTFLDAKKDLKEINELLKCSNNHNLNISDWEINFIESLEKFDDYSEKQMNMIQKIARKI